MKTLEEKRNQLKEERKGIFETNLDRSFIVIDEKTKEVLAIIDNRVLVEQPGIRIVINENPDEDIIREDDGKLFLNKSIQGVEVDADTKTT